MMEKIILSVLLFCALSSSSVAQNTVAKLKFEEAEEAYANNNLEVALAKLKETETILKATNPRILYLQILAQNKIITNDTLKDYSIIEATRKAINKYLKDYDNLPDNEDKYRDIYKISESFKAMPASRQVFDELVSKKAKAKQELADAAAVKLKKNQLSVLELAARYGFKPNVTMTEFAALSPKNKSIAGKKKQPTVRDGKNRFHRGDNPIFSVSIGPYTVFTDENDLLVSMHYIGAKGSKGNRAQKLAEFVADVKQNVDKEFIEDIKNGYDDIGVYPGVIVTVPGTDLIIRTHLDSSTFNIFFHTPGN